MSLDIEHMFQLHDSTYVLFCQGFSSSCEAGEEAFDEGRPISWREPRSASGPILRAPCHPPPSAL